MDYKKLNTILYRFSSHYKLGNPNVVSSIILNIDYLIVNFAYFSDLDVVLEYFLFDNQEFALALRDRFDLFVRNLNYRKELKNYKIFIKKREEPTTPRKNKLVYDKLDPPSQNKVMLWKGALGGLALKKLYSSWLRTGGGQEDFHAFLLNDEEKVYEGVFKVLVAHYESFQRKVLPGLGQKDLEKILRFIELDTVQVLIRRMLNRKTNEVLFNTLRLFEGAKACEFFLSRGRYYELLLYLEAVVETKGLTDSQSSDEEHNVWDELYGVKDLLLDLFCKGDSFFDWKLIYQILEILYRVKSDGKLDIVDVEGCSLKKKYYVRLLCLASESSLDGVYNSGLHVSFISLFFDNPNDSFYAHNLFKFFKSSFRIKVYADKLKENGFVEALKGAILRNAAMAYEGRPKTEAIYPYCVYLALEAHPHTCEDGDFITVYNLSRKVVEGDSLGYNDLEKIDLYLEDCINEVLVRYVCNLVIDRMPVLSAFLSRDHHPLSTVANAETKEEKRTRLGGGMQDTL